MELASAVLALPENIRTLIEMGFWIKKRIELYRNTSTLLENWKTYGYDLYAGDLRLQVELATRFSSDETNEGLVTKSHLAGLTRCVAEAKAELERCGAGDKDTDLNRLYYALTGRRKLKGILKQFRERVYDFTVFMILADMARRTRPKTSMLLTPSEFMTTSRYGGEYSTPLNGRQKIRTGAAEYKSRDGKIEDVKVLFERQEVSEKSADDVEEMVAELSTHLDIEPGSMCGILRCLGFRKEPRLEFIFQIPDGLNNPTALQQLITEHDPILITERVRLAQQLAEAVALVHATKLVHKSLRPETILILEDSTPADPKILYRPFLTDWSMMRRMGDPSGRTGSDAWVENIYRHPQRQGLQLETRYHMGHDIYSLGVTMLEIGLWKPFIDKKGGELQPSQLYRHAAMDSNVITEEMSEEQKIKTLLKPALVKQILLHLALNELSKHMGEQYADIVRTCLCAVEEGIGGASAKQFKGEPVVVSQRFRHVVIEPLTGIMDQDEE